MRQLVIDNQDMGKLKAGKMQDQPILVARAGGDRLRIDATDHVSTRATGMEGA